MRLGRDETSSPTPCVKHTFPFLLHDPGRSLFWSLFWGDGSLGQPSRPSACPRTFSLGVGAGAAGSPFPAPFPRSRQLRLAGHNIRTSPRDSASPQLLSRREVNLLHANRAHSHPSWPLMSKGSKAFPQTRRDTHRTQFQWWGSPQPRTPPQLHMRHCRQGVRLKCSLLTESPH